MTRPGPAQTRARRVALLGQVSGPLRRFLRTEAGGAALMLAATVVALVWANSPWSEQYLALWETEASLGIGRWELPMDLHHWSTTA